MSDLPPETNNSIATSLREFADSLREERHANGGCITTTVADEFIAVLDEAANRIVGKPFEPGDRQDAERYRYLRGHGVIFDEGLDGDGARRIFGVGLDNRVDSYRSCDLHNDATGESYLKPCTCKSSETCECCTPERKCPDHGAALTSNDD